MKQPWKVSTFYRESWKLTKSHPELWILGLMAVFFSQSSGNNLDLSDSDTTDNETRESETVETEPTHFEMIGENLGTIAFGVWDKTPLQVWGFLGLEILVLLIFGIVWGLISGSWVQANLMLGVQKARVQKKVSLPEVIQSAISRIRPLIWLSIVPGLMILLAIILFGIVGLILNQLGALISILYLGLGVIALLFCTFRISTALHWATRYCVLQKMNGRDALRAGWKTSKGNIQKTLGLMLANWLVGGLASFLIFLPAASLSLALILPMVFSESFSWWVVGPIVAAVLITLPIHAAFQALWWVFTTATWQLGFESIQLKTETT